MPKLGENKWLLDIVFFVYPDCDSAQAGRGVGGTGFLVAVPSAKKPEEFHHVYGVSNYHAVVQQGASVVRVNRHDGECQIFDFDPSEWHFMPNGPDVAVIPLNLSANEHRVEAITPSFFLTRDQIVQYEINAGDDVFMIGRFLDADGVEVNQPALRFGHISILSLEGQAKFLPWNHKGSTHVIDMHSRTGFSGSPVFVYRTTGSIFSSPNTLVGGGHMLKLLGIHYGQFEEELRVQSADQGANGITVVHGLSGMSCVCPASSIMDVLNLSRLQDLREEIERRL